MLVDWIRFTDIERSYGTRRVFEGLSGVLRDGIKVALVGPNGAGKSSLVRILAGLETPDHGSVIFARDAKLGYLGQAASAEQNATLREILERGFAHIREEEEGLRALERELSAASDAGDAKREERALREYGELRESFDRHGGEGLERRMRSMLVAFGFDDADLDRDARGFSGGQRTRVALASMLIDEPDYCILDEPTNHLDLQTVRWLEDFLVEDPRAMLVVSHDRYFLDRVADEIWELDGGVLSRYEVKRGRAYSSYVEQKAERAELARREYENYVAEKKRQEAVVAELRTHGSHNYSHVRSREKQFAKLEEVAAPKTSQQQISVKLEASRRATTGLALKARHLTKQYEKALFRDVSFDLKRGDRLALVGPNGAGKSTLLNMLSGKTVPDKGTVEIMTGVRTADFAQDTTDDLGSSKTAVDAVLDGATISPQDARNLLGRLGLSGDAGDKPVESFSGGERRRIMLARLMARSADCLFLDEPTNDLDIPSREALEEVLAGYDGAIVVVSHDRYLLERLAQRVLWIRDGEATLIEDGYDRFEALQRPGAVAEAPAKTAAKPVEKPVPQREKNKHEIRALAQCERDIARLDGERARLQLEFADPAAYDDAARVAALTRSLDETERALETAYARWETLAG